MLLTQYRPQRLVQIYVINTINVRMLMADISASVVIVIHIENEAGCTKYKFEKIPFNLN